MDSAAQLVQTTLTGLGIIAGGPLFANQTGNITQNTTSPWIPQSTPVDPTGAFNLNTVLSLVLSFSALRDWIKLFVIGSGIETCRRVVLKLWATFIESFWITACFDGNDDSYSTFLVATSFQDARLTFLCQIGSCSGFQNTPSGVSIYHVLTEFMC